MILPAFLWVFLSAASTAQVPETVREITVQARPVAVWLKAVKDGDHEQLKTVFSERMRRRFDAEGWDNVLKTYQEAFNREFGEYTPQDFSFQFVGDENQGRVLITYRGRTLSGLRVVKEQNEWKVDER
jgi:hypothetical protein